MSRFQGQFEVEDGYAGGSRPQFFNVELSDAEYELPPNPSDGQIEDWYYEQARYAFEQKIGFYTKNNAELIAAVRDVLSQQENEDE